MEDLKIFIRYFILGHYLFIFIEKNASLGTLNILSWNCVTPGCVTVVTLNNMQKDRKWTARLPLSTGYFSIAQAGFFYMLYYKSGAFLRYNNSSKILRTKPWFSLSKFRKFSLFMKALKIGIFGRFLAE